MNLPNKILLIFLSGILLFWIGLKVFAPKVKPNVIDGTRLKDGDWVVDTLYYDRHDCNHMVTIIPKNKNGAITSFVSCKPLDSFEVKLFRAALDDTANYTVLNYSGVGWMSVGKGAKLY